MAKPPEQAPISLGGDFSRTEGVLLVVFVCVVFAGVSLLASNLPHRPAQPQSCIGTPR